jgi:hypothetical protein
MNLLEIAPRNEFALLPLTLREAGMNGESLLDFCAFLDYVRTVFSCGLLTLINPFNKTESNAN